MLVNGDKSLTNINYAFTQSVGVEKKKNAKEQYHSSWCLQKSVHVLLMNDGALPPVPPVMTRTSACSTPAPENNFPCAVYLVCSSYCCLAATVSPNVLVF